MTAQIHEVLVRDGKRGSMAFCPPLPEGHARLVAAATNAVGHPGDDEAMILHSTACWRGYQGEWEIKDGRFYLTGVRGRFRLVGDEPLLADWFSGVLRVPEGELLSYVHMGFGSVYEREVHIKIERGLVTATRTIDNRGKPRDEWTLGLKNPPGGENRFEGDDEL